MQESQRNQNECRGVATDETSYETGAGEPVQESWCRRAGAGVVSCLWLSSESVERERLGAVFIGEIGRAHV